MDPMGKGVLVPWEGYNNYPTTQRSSSQDFTTNVAYVEPEQRIRDVAFGGHGEKPGRLLWLNERTQKELGLLDILVDLSQWNYILYIEIYRYI